MPQPPQTTTYTSTVAATTNCTHLGSSATPVVSECHTNQLLDNQQLVTFQTNKPQQMTVAGGTTTTPEPSSSPSDCPPSQSSSSCPSPDGSSLLTTCSYSGYLCGCFIGTSPHSHQQFNHLRMIAYA
eukprot:GHVS01072015.1.p2 GENE.GHVS01072015.1~~GHVS01072015.1.p2  ORF type:complete len:127 (-),score=32.22 GHVS01072015.1:22-402(-)